jgi:hypothetical protein
MSVLSINSFGSVVIGPASSRTVCHGDYALSYQRQPGDALAVANVTFSGVPDDTEVRVFRASDDVELDGIELWTQSSSLILPFYGVGNSLARWVFINVAYDVLAFFLETPRNDTQIPIVMRKSRIEEQAQ